MRFVHAAHEQGAAGESLSVDCLLVRRGRTQFPLRTLTSDRYSIGSGTNCHLQLGVGVPMLHSQLTRNPEGWILEAIASEPPLLVNGAVCRRELLHADDVIRIGSFEFVLCCNLRVESGGDAQAVPAGLSRRRAMIANDASRLSARELVHRLEGELRLIELMGHSRAVGGTMLLRAIQRQGQVSHPRAA